MTDLKETNTPETDRDGRFWYNELNRFHRLDGPAIELSSGHKYWYVNGERHRLDGPACEYASGAKVWWVNDKRHRLDGPAAEESDGTALWWYVNGVELSGPLDLIEHGAKLEDIAEYLTPREIALCRT